ncbi:MAG TPA: hypothetical protein VNS09_15970 [Solirubrobacter sp.]|nr:hypothetical protein [Solirubrobacter sp.]
MRWSLTTLFALVLALAPVSANARERTPTKVTIKAAKTVKAGKPFKFTGSVSGGVDVGYVRVTMTSSRGEIQLVAKIQADGTFRPNPVEAVTHEPGTFTLKVRFRGDATHKPSSATAKIRVTAH